MALSAGVCALSVGVALGDMDHTIHLPRSIVGWVRSWGIVFVGEWLRRLRRGFDYDQGAVSSHCRRRIGNLEAASTDVPPRRMARWGFPSHEIRV